MIILNEKDAWKKDQIVRNPVFLKIEFLKELTNLTS